jgi:DNA-binding CsgD family transcriptional regulator
MGLAMIAPFTRRTIDALYERVGEPDALSAINAVIMDALDVDNSGIWLSRNGVISDLVVSDVIKASSEPYLRYYHKIDAWTLHRPAPNLVSLGYERVDEGELVRSEFYNDFARHFEMLRPMGVTLTLGQGVVATVASNRGSRQHMLDDGDKPVLQALVPHLRGALALQHLFGGSGQALYASRDGLDAQAHGVVLCDGHGRVAFANQAAQALAQGQDFFALGARDTGLRAVLPRDNQRLLALIGRAAEGQPGSLWLAGRNGQSLHVLVTPVPASRHGQARVMISIGLNRNPTGISEDGLQHMFGLSPAQAALCLLLAGGHTLEAAAALRGIAKTTARTHYSAILIKTGAGSMRGLMMLLARLPIIGTGF